ncbi:hypothetical protein DFP72DRAFT_456544 [Ephemerocybe angulata]|uniref:Uncharacterized protein n=1 Tax=Ephemerocybe angulata TaxID=980116 RepID=A0A8H6M3V7_9AGAR|nr:hypothetical protein DFP72DRAFT_456544 [Tulosesus angulatus]
MALPNRKVYTGNSRRLLLAFDIGTTFSGISYSILDPGTVPEIRPVTRYPSQEQVGGDSKIPTVIYYDAMGKSCAIGAETLKEGIETDAEENGWNIAKWFKLHLRPKKPAAAGRPNPNEPELPPLPPNKTVEQVLTDFMRYLRECAKIYIAETHGDRLWASLEGDIMYVLTHPNGWEGQQQAQMRRAAVCAGLTPNGEEANERITFVTEGEASLHFCISNGLAVSQTDTGVLIVDAGGGTIDITAYRKLSQQTFEEISIPSCHFQGGAYVTMRAEKHFKNLLAGSRFFHDVDVLTTRFDRNTKHVFRREDEPHHIQFASHRERDATLNIRGGRLTLAGRDVAAFFQPSIDAIVQAIKDQRAAAHFPIKTVFLVGGFSASNWLCDKVRRAIEPLGIAVSRPDSHVNKAVSNGAVSFYLDSAVSSRVSRFTYGMECRINYDPRNPQHRPRAHMAETYTVTGERMLSRTFATILPKNERVSEMKEYRRDFVYHQDSATPLGAVSHEILSYSGASTVPTFLDDEPSMFPSTCVVQADLSVVPPELRVSSTGRMYYVFVFQVVLLFGLTELKAQAVYKDRNGTERRSAAKVVYEGP